VSSSFSALGVPADLVERLARRGVHSPFPVQAATLPDALAGRDVSGRAPTGSGKTIAFGIPLVTRVGRAEPRRPRGLVLVPTRELAGQVHAELVALAGPSGPSAVAVYGGVGFERQISALRRGVDVVVACPGRLADLLSQRHLSLEDVGFVVIDEADRMADMGFLPEVRRLLDQVRSDRQTLLFSATLDGDVDVLVRRYQRAPVRHELAAEPDAPQSRHVFWRAERHDRVALVAGLVGREWPAIVFCRTRHGADRLTRQLSKAGVAAAAIHGDRSQSQRERALAGLANGSVQALVATDVAARGIHVDDVACVVHFDPPGDDKAYVHRSGRTGRAGAAGLVVSLVDGAAEADTRVLQKALGLPVGLSNPGSSDVATIPSSTPKTGAPPRRSGHQRRRRGGGSRGRAAARR
jgi:superfamily II DNA/RNA helicase